MCFKLFIKEDIGFFDFNLVRHTVGIIAFTILILVTKKHPIKSIPDGLHLSVFGRVLWGEFAFWAFGYSLLILPITIHTILLQTNPLWTSVLSLFFLAEKIKMFEYVAMAIAFGGVILIGIGGTKAAAAIVDVD